MAAKKSRGESQELHSDNVFKADTSEPTHANDDLDDHPRKEGGTSQQLDSSSCYQKPAELAEKREVEIDVPRGESLEDCVTERSFGCHGTSQNNVQHGGTISACVNSEAIGVTLIAQEAEEECGSESFGDTVTEQSLDCRGTSKDSVPNGGTSGECKVTSKENTEVVTSGLKSLQPTRMVPKRVHSYATESPCQGGKRQRIGPLTAQLLSIIKSDVEGSILSPSSKILPFFLVDAVENGGQLVLFGRSLETDGIFVSTAVFFRDPQRQLFLQPRPGFSVADVWNEFNEKIAPANGISGHCGHMVRKKFAFDLTEPPCERDVLEVCYPANCAKVDRRISGATFCQAFGTQTPLLETFLLQRRIRAPCWLDVAVTAWPSEADAPRTTCFASLLATQVSVAARHRAAAQLTVSALGLRCHDGMLAAFTVATATHAPLEDDGGAEPAHVMAGSSVESGMHEGDVLLELMNAVRAADPDVLLGHGIQKQLSVVADRASALWVDSSPLGRLLDRCYDGTTMDAERRLRELTCGRVLIDLKPFAKELQVAARDYELHSLLDAVLSPSERLSLNDTSAESLAALGSAALASRLGAVVLVMELANLTGGLPARIARYGRAERVQRLLDLEFAGAEYVLPDKIYKERRPEGAGFEGGLVLKPVPGIRRTFVLYLDFRALYPSLVIERDICFTRPDLRPSMTGDPPRSPLASVLPVLMKRLLSARVDAQTRWAALPPTTAEAQRLDVAQRALKMTANAIYGCLGSPAGRYPATHLAAAIAAAGRALLEETRALVVEKFKVAVIYGDTDSLMVDTGMTDLNDAMALSTSILEAVNTGHTEVRLKLEAVFDRVLIVGKKTYAARAPEIPGLQTSELVVKGLVGGRRGNPAVVGPLFRSVLATVFSDASPGAQAEQVPALLAAFSSALPSSALPALSASRVLHRDLGCYVAPPPIAAVAARLAALGHAIGAGDAVEVVVCGDAAQGPARGRLYALSEAASQGLRADVVYVKDTFAMPAVRQVTTAAGLLDVSAVAAGLGLPAATYTFAVPKPPTRKDPYFGLRVPRALNKPHISLACEACSWKIPLDAGGYNRNKHAFTLARCQNLACSWKPYNHIANVTAQVVGLTNQQADFMGWDKCSAQVGVIHANVAPPAGNADLVLHCAYVEVQAELEQEMERRRWGHEDLGAAFSVGRRIAEQEQCRDAEELAGTRQSPS